MSRLKNYYAVLGVRPSADHSEIEAAYERLSRVFQPDIDAAPLEPERKQELDEAFDVLDDASRRAAYDRARADPSSHLSARNIASWLGVVGWVILLGGLLGAILIGLSISSSCDETTILGETANDCSQERTVAWIVAAAVAVQSIVSALIFFAGRHVILLLAEIAEKE